jgi:hypothetical protein
MAERAAKAAFSPDQVAESLPYALKKDLLGGPIAEIREIMGGATLFPHLMVEQFELLRQSHYGSAAANHLIDCAVETAASGLSGDAGTEVAVKNACEGIARDALRGIEEHYQREATSRSAGYVRDRLDLARQQLDRGKLARELLSSQKLPSQRSVNLPRQSGIDEGPPL